MPRRWLGLMGGLILGCALLSCGGSHGDNLPMLGAPEIQTGLVPQSFPVGAPISVTVSPTETIHVKISAGQSLTMSVNATGAHQLLYQWTFKGRNISGADQPTFTLESVKEGVSDGPYGVSVANSHGYARSADVWVTVQP